MSTQLLLFTALLLLLLCMAAWHDLATRQIPNGLVGATAALGLLFRASEGALPLAWSALAATALFAALLIPFLRGWLGGGDVKLLTALGFGIPPALLLDVLTFITLAGGVLAATHLALRNRVPVLALQPRRAALGRVLALEARRIRRGDPLPYGIAIALGTATALVLAGS